MKLYLDDIRVTPKGFDLRAYTAAEAIEMLKTNTITFISLDHDLGPVEAGTGADVAQWIEEQAFTNPDFVMPLAYWSHSGNPVGVRNINAAMNAAYFHRDIDFEKDCKNIRYQMMCEVEY